MWTRTGRRVYWLCKRTILLVVVFLITVVWEYSLIPFTYAPLDTAKESGIREFGTQWCRLQRWRVDWRGMIRPCNDRMPWNRRQVNSVLRTNAGRSFVSKWELQPAGHFSRFFIQSVTSHGEPKTVGGDSWRVYIRQGPSSLAPVVFDLNNGVYEVLFLVLEPGSYTAQIWLDFTLCDGFRDPPVDWFVKGTTDGKYQKEGTLGYIGEDYIEEPLAGRENVTFHVPRSEEDSKRTGFYSYCESDSTDSGRECSLEGLTRTCGVVCPMMWDGHGRWMGNSWKPYTIDVLPNIQSARNVSNTGILWAFGDSVTQGFLASIRQTELCQGIFQECKGSYNWVYELKNIEEAKSKYDNLDYNESIILDQIQRIVSREDMNRPESVFLFNLGIHYSVTLNFTTYNQLISNVIALLQKTYLDEGSATASRYRVDLVWKSSTAIEKEKVHRYFGGKNSTGWRFHTYQRVLLFHTYAMHSMCRAGIKVLDLYPISASYPKGTLDHVHYPRHVFQPAESLLRRYFGT